MNKMYRTYARETMEQTVKSGELAGVSALVFHGGEEVFFQACGEQDMENHVPLMRDTIFRLFSMTKPMTAAAAMILIQQGLLDVFAPVSRYLDGFAHQQVATAMGTTPVRQQMTIKDLLNMTSGLVYPGEGNPAEKQMRYLFAQVKRKLENDQPTSTVEFANLIGRQPLAFHPGESWQYGTSSDVLGAIIERVSGMPFSLFLKRELFEPLQMVDTGFYVPNEKIHRFSRLYQMKDGRLQVFPHNHLGLNDYMTPPVFESGGAGLVSTIDDSLRFCRMMLGRGKLDGTRVLSESAIDFMTHNQLSSVQRQGFQWDSLRGFGYSCYMRVMENPSQSPTFGSVGEYGWDGWTGTYFTIDPVHEMILIVMMQKTDAGTTELVRKLRNIVFSGLET